ncbi:hypothetical protein HA466_0131330 [Hirschfeldia incana]|nr:hypothetical protein HA466_0131330 [Hirschfeldia incana]
MPASFNHVRLSRSMSHRHGGTPPCFRASVTIAHFLLKASSSWTNLIRSSSTTICFNGHLFWDSKETRRTTLPICLAEGPVYSEDPASPRSETHRLPFDGGRSTSGACLLSFPSYPLKSRVGLRVSLIWAWTTKLTIGTSPQTSHPNLKTTSIRGQKMQPRLPCVVSQVRVGLQRHIM